MAEGNSEAIKNTPKIAVPETVVGDIYMSKQAEPQFALSESVGTRGRHGLWVVDKVILEVVGLVVGDAGHRLLGPRATDCWNVYLYWNSEDR